MTGRSVPEWIGATPDTPVPLRVKLRVFERHGGVCHISGRKIRPGDDWDTDHVKDLALGGLNRESNLAPALKEPHKAKTRITVAAKAKADRMKAKHLGLVEKKPWPGTKRWKRKVRGKTVERNTEETR